MVLAIAVHGFQYIFNLPTHVFTTGRVTSGIYEYDKDEYFAVPLINGKVKILSILLLVNKDVFQ